jgi:hypothetical protein
MRLAPVRFSRSFVLLGLVCLTLAAACFGWASPAAATPMYSVSSAHACNTCHVEPTGWLNPDKADRRCTLDCQGCHVNPSGGGMRTPLGSFYGEEVLPMFGPRPGERANPARFLREGEPSEGGFDMFGAWNGGWWPGEVQHREIPDRYGDIDPAPRYQVGTDIRIMNVTTEETKPSGLERGTAAESATFPMEFEVYGAYHPASNVTAYLDLGVQGQKLLPDGETYASAAEKRAWVRETFVMLHDLPGSQYVRAGRFFQPYGWRIPDHTAYTRRDTGFDQNRQAFGVEWGHAYYESWSNVMLWHEGVESWPGELKTNFEENGVTAQGGWRGMNYTAGGTVHYGKRAADDTVEFAAGPMWALSLFPLIYMGELDYSSDTRNQSESGATVKQLAAFHELQWHGSRGISPKFRYEWEDPDLALTENAKSRLMGGVEFNPYAGLQFDILYRYETSENPKVSDKGQWLSQVHMFY